MHWNWGRRIFDETLPFLQTFGKNRKSIKAVCRKRRNVRRRRFSVRLPYVYCLCGSDSQPAFGKRGEDIAGASFEKGEIVEKEVLFEALWGTTEYIDENVLQVTMTRLRKSLDKLGLRERIETVRGIGYRLNSAKK